jgi:hypothetical protein
MKQSNGSDKLIVTPALSMIAAVVVLVVNFATINASAQTAPCTQPDHLKCYRVGDDPFVNTNLLSLDSPQFGLEPGCQVKGHAILFCVPVCKTILTSPPPTGTGFQASTVLTDDELCYSVSCTTNNAPRKLGVQDQFAARTVPLGNADLICAPAEKLTPPPGCGFAAATVLSAAQCGGACPQSQACEFTPAKRTAVGVTPATCLCAQTASSCGNTAPPGVAPKCGGACPPTASGAEQLCRDLGGNCACTPF